MYNLENIDIIWMRYAIILADYAKTSGEISVGAVLVYNGKIIGYGWNSSIKHHDPTAHAEILALRMAGQVLSNYRLLGTTLYVTLAPCMMCIGAMIHARIFRIVCGAMSKHSKYHRSNTICLKDILQSSVINHRVFLTIGILENECSMLLNDFFVQRRKSSNKNKFL